MLKFVWSGPGANRQFVLLGIVFPYKPGQGGKPSGIIHILYRTKAQLGDFELLTPEMANIGGGVQNIHKVVCVIYERPDQPTSSMEYAKAGEATHHRCKVPTKSSVSAVLVGIKSCRPQEIAKLYYCRSPLESSMHFKCPRF